MDDEDSMSELPDRREEDRDEIQDNVQGREEAVDSHEEQDLDMEEDSSQSSSKPLHNSVADGFILMLLSLQSRLFGTKPVG